MSDIPTKYFRKELYSTPLFLSRGVRAPFQPVGGDEGVLATNDAAIIYSLTNAVEQRIGGVSEITKEKYEALKKKERTTSGSNRTFQRQAPRVVAAPPHGSVTSRYWSPPSAPSVPAAVAKEAPPKPQEAQVSSEPKKPVAVRRGKIPKPPPPQ